MFGGAASPADDCSTPPPQTTPTPTPTPTPTATPTPTPTPTVTTTVTTTATATPTDSDSDKSGVVVVGVTASGSAAGFSYRQVCGHDSVTFTLTDGQSHKTSPVDADTDCTVTQTDGPPGSVDIAVKGSSHKSSVQTNPPQGSGTVPAAATLEFAFTAPAGGVSVGQISPAPLPTVIALPGEAADAFAPPGQVRTPVVAPASPTESAEPSAGASPSPLNSFAPSALATPPSPGVQPEGVAAMSLAGGVVIGAGAAFGRRAVRTGS
ncbi:MAG TPA: hypothetical protein VHV76_05125 [Mycobacteriales bacterium]|nr:hypothetical protein [Mycobacteriales bacterium]